MRRLRRLSASLPLLVALAGCGGAGGDANDKPGVAQEESAHAFERARRAEENAARLEAELTRLSDALPDDPGDPAAKPPADVAPAQKVASVKTAPVRDERVPRPAGAAVLPRRGAVAARAVRSAQPMSASALQRAIAPNGVLIDRGKPPNLDYSGVR